MPVQLEIVPEDPKAILSSFELIESSSSSCPPFLRLTPSVPVTLNSDIDLTFFNPTTGQFLSVAYVESGIFDKTKFSAVISDKFPINTPSPVAVPAEDSPEILGADGCTWKFLSDTIFLQLGNPKMPTLPLVASEFHKGIFSKRLKFFVKFPTRVRLLFDGGVFKSGDLTFSTSDQISDFHEFHLGNESGSVEGVVWFAAVDETSQRRQFLSIRAEYPGDGLALLYGAMPDDLTAVLLADFANVAGCTVRRKGSKTTELEVDVGAVPATALPRGAAENAGEEGRVVVVAEGEGGEEKGPTFLDRTRPKDALTGVTSGLKAMGGGLLAGTAALVVAPVVEVQEKGAVGVFTGLAKGIGGFLGLGLGGAVAGVGQVVRGVANTPEAMRQGKHMKWDKERGEWFDQRVDLEALRRLFEEEKNNEEVGGKKEYEGKKEVKDKKLYEVLGVETSAKMEDIKKAYRRKALELHPDKQGRGNNLHAAQDFQELNQAYSILVDPIKRSAYDSQGLKSDQATSNLAQDLDPKAFFSALFGGEKFHAYTGDLQLASEAATLIAETPEESFDVRRRQKLRREVLCGLHVLEKLKVFVEDRDDTLFVKNTVMEALELAKENFGPELLETIGFAYENRAKQWLLEAQGERIERKWVSWKSTGKAIARKAAMVGSLAKTAMAAKRMHAVAEEASEAAERLRTEVASGKTVDAGTSDAAQKASEQVQEMFKEAFPQFLATVWDVSNVDIAKTSKGVAKKILMDMSTPWQILWRRAKALELFGRIWRGVGSSRIEASKKGNMQDVEKALHSSIRR